MNKIKIMFVLTLVLVCIATASVQITTNGTGGGKWSAASTWAGGTVPTGSEAITIAAGDSVEFDQAVTITGSITKMSVKRDSISGSLTFGSSGLYTHAVNGGSIPTATWLEGSNCVITGVTSTAPSNANQNYYNFTWNCTNQSSNLNVAWNGNTLSGSLFVTSTGSSQFRLSNNTFGQSASAPNVITIKGNVVVSGTSLFTATGSGTPIHYIRVVVEGDFICTDAGVVFQLANGSGAYGSWWMKGNVTIKACSLATNKTYPDTLVFCGNQKQVFDCTVDMSNYNIAVYSGAIVEMPAGSAMGTTTVAPSFRMEDGATFICGSPAGLVGNITATSTAIKIGTACNFVFNGTSAQVTSTLMQDTVNNLKIANSAGVILSQPTLVNGVLELNAGVLDNSTNAITIGTSGSVIWTGGTSTVEIPGWPQVSVDKFDITGIPESFFVAQNYPNPFNPSTMISYGIPNDAYVTAKVFNILGQEVTTLFSGYKQAGVHKIEFNASSLVSGVYFCRIEAGNQVDVKRMLLVK